MNLEAILALLGLNKEKGADAQTALKALLDGKDKTVKDLKARVKAETDAAKALKDKIAKLADAIGVDEDAENLDEAIEAALKDAKGKVDPAAAKQLARLQKQLKETTDDLTGKLNAEKGKRHESMIRSALMDELTKQNAVKPQALVDLFKGRVKVDDEDKLVFDEAATLADGLKAYFKDNPELVKVEQKGGPGGAGKPGAGGGSKGDEDENFGQKLAKDYSVNNKEVEEAQAAYFK